MIAIPRHWRADALGMLLSGACMLHCLLLPVVVGLGVGGTLAGFDTEWTHVIMLALVLPVSGLAFLGGWVRHRRAAVVALGASGVLLLALAAFVIHPFAGKVGDALVTTMGGAMLAVAHWRNRDCPCPHDDTEHAAQIA